MKNDWLNYIKHSSYGVSRSKYKGGFVNGKNTSAYNHDYYIHNKDKWGVSNTTRQMGNPDLLPPESELSQMNDDEFIAALAKAGYYPESPEELRAAFLQLSNDPSYKAAIYSITKDQWAEVYAKTKPQFDNYHEQHGSSGGISYMHTTPGEGQANNPQAYDYGNQKRPHGRKRGETTASVDVHKRGQVDFTRSSYKVTRSGSSSNDSEDEPRTPHYLGPNAKKKRRRWKAAQEKKKQEATKNSSGVR